MKLLFLLATEAAGAEAGGFGFNPDIIEANVINLLVVIGLVFYAGRNFLSNLLTERRTAIETEINEAEQKRDAAAKALAEQQEKLAQAKAEADQIVVSAQKRASVLRDEILAKAVADVQRMRETAAADVTAEQDRVIAELRQRAVVLALSKAESELPKRLDDAAQQRLIERSLATLGGR